MNYKEILELFPEINMKKILSIKDWPRLEIDHNLPYTKKNKTINDILNLIDKGSGFYSYFDGEKCLYFGIGSKSISKRLKDHYFETHSTKTPSRGALWNEFFSKYKKPLTIRYFSFRGHKDDLINKKVLELLEAIILKENDIEFENFRANKREKNKNG